MIREKSIIQMIRNISSELYIRFFLRFDKFYFAKKAYRLTFGKKMNMDSPGDLIEKYYWLEKYTDLSMMTKCADKYAVREFIKERGCEEILNQLYAKWDTPDEIDFSNLPDSFILKINNGSGDVTIVEDKSKVDVEEIKKHFRALYSEKYGLVNAQCHYWDIKPCIIAEKLLPKENTPFSDSIIDYKVWCFDGQPESIWVAYNRFSGHVCMDLFDTNWNSMPQYLHSIPHYQYHPENVIPRPVSLDAMLRYASILSKGFPEVRVDFYEISGNVVFGEMTFTTGYGYFTADYYQYLGSKTELPSLYHNNPH